MNSKDVGETDEIIWYIDQVLNGKVLKEEFDRFSLENLKNLKTLKENLLSRKIKVEKIFYTDDGEKLSWFKLLFSEEEWYLIKLCLHAAFKSDIEEPNAFFWTIDYVGISLNEPFDSIEEYVDSFINKNQQSIRDCTV